MTKRIAALYKLLHTYDIKKGLYSNRVYIACENMFDVEKKVMKLFNKHKNDPDNRVILFRITILQADDGHTFEDEREIAVFDAKNVIEGGSFFSMTEHQYASITEQEHEALFAYLQSESFKDPSKATLSDLEKSGEWVFDALSQSDIWACKRYANLLSVVLDYERQIAELNAILAEKREELDTLVHYDPNTQMYILRKDD